MPHERPPRRDGPTTVEETDTDGDGTPDCIDQCSNDPEKTVICKCGWGIPDTDSDDGDDRSDDSGGYPEDRETEKDTGDTNNCFISIAFGSEG